MKQIGYVIQFRGTAGPKEGEEGVLSAKTTGSASRISTAVDDGPVDATIEAIAGNSVSFVSDVFPNEDGSFTESGTIDFGGGNSFAFSTRGTGEMGPCADPNLTMAESVERSIPARDISMVRPESSLLISR